MQEKLRDLGKGRLIREADTGPARGYLWELNEQGMSLRDMAHALGVSYGNMSHLMHAGGMRRGTYERILALRWDPGELKGQRKRRGTYVPILGVQRRVQGLYTIGFGYKWQARQLGIGGKSYGMVRDLIFEGGQSVAYQTHVDIAALYTRFENERAEDHIASHVHIGKAIADGKRRGWAPPCCWDPDTIDDPQAIPQWTGDCGTYKGYFAHRRYGIPACRPCKDAANGNARKRYRENASAGH